MITRTLFISLAFVSFTATAQVNLVPNHSFEEIDSCSYHFWANGTIQYAQNWFTPFSYPFPNGGGSVDLFSNCITDSTYSTPSNIMGYQAPHSGDNYAGLYLIAGSGREYIENELVNPLESGKRYCVKFYYCFAEYYTMFTDRLGVVFTSDSLLNLDSISLVIHSTPNIELDSGYITEDTMNWLVFEKEFTAQGDEKFFTIGNFKYNSECTMVQMGGGPLSLLSYIYLDDVSVTLCDDTTDVVETPRWKKHGRLYPNPSDDKVTYQVFNKPATSTYTVTLADVVSREGYRVELQHETVIISTADLDVGVYLLRCYDGEKLVDVQKLTVAR